MLKKVETFEEFWNLPIGIVVFAKLFEDDIPAIAITAPSRYPKRGHFIKRRLRTATKTHYRSIDCSFMTCDGQYRYIRASKGTFDSAAEFFICEGLALVEIFDLCKVIFRIANGGILFRLFEKYCK